LKLMPRAMSAVIAILRIACVNGTRAVPGLKA